MQFIERLVKKLLHKLICACLGHFFPTSSPGLNEQKTMILCSWHPCIQGGASCMQGASLRWAQSVRFYCCKSKDIIPYIILLY